MSWINLATLALALVAGVLGAKMPDIGWVCYPIAAFLVGAVIPSPATWTKGKAADKAEGEPKTP